MKPIFDEEKIFLEEHLKIKLPECCWRDGTKIYLNSDNLIPLIQFKVEGKQFTIKKNIIKNISSDLVSVEYKKGTKNIKETWHNKLIEEEYLENENIILAKEKESVDNTVEYINKYPDYELRQSDSGGKDSTLEKIIVDKAFNELGITDYIVDCFNTSNDTAHTYKQIKQFNDSTKLQIHSPKKGWRMWLKEDKNYFIPSIMVRNCCSTYKEGQLNKVLDKKKKYVLFLGMRKYESTKRADYDWDMNEALMAKAVKEAKKKQEKDGGELEVKFKLNVPENWKRFLPIVEWKDNEVWLYLIHNNVPFNYMYRLGFERCGCLICPFQSDYTDLLIEKHYPAQWNRWLEVLEKNYEIWDIKRLKWTLEEWKQGKWKAGTSKEQDLIQKKPTEERIKLLAEIKGISIEIATKYFKKQCSCGKKLNPDEVGMNLKIYGRDMDVSKMECKNCMCKSLAWTKDEYQENVIAFREQGCNLF